LKQPLRSAEAWRYVDAGKIRHSLALIDRLLAVIWRLTN